MRHKLRAAREEKGFTQGDMAKALGYKSKSHYCMIESGQRGVSVEIALAIADILQKPVESLFRAADVHGLLNAGRDEMAAVYSAD